MSKELSRYVGFEVAPRLYSISASLNRGDRESAIALGERLLDSGRDRLSTDFKLEPYAHSLFLEISGFVGKIKRGEDTTDSLSRAYDEAEMIVPWLNKDSCSRDIYPVD